MTGFDLGRLPTAVDPLYASKADYERQLEDKRAELAHLQEMLFADARYALLLILQGPDSAGKGGVIKHVLSGLNPHGVRVHGFGPPSREDLAHDFLWRAWARLPERGRIGVFDRSYYEEVITVRAQPALLAAQKLPQGHDEAPAIWRERLADIVQFEAYLRRNGTHLVKVYLHLSPAEQRQRLLARIDEPDKNWKMTRSDLEARRLWPAYQAAAAAAFAATSSDHAPWHVVPADDKRTARLLVADLLLAALKAMPLRYPRANGEQKAELAEMRRLLEGEEG